MKLRAFLLLFVFAIAGLSQDHPAKKPDRVDVERIKTLVAEQQKRANRWNEIQQEVRNLQAEFTATQKQIDDVTADAVKRAGLDPKSFDVDQEKGEFVPKPPAAKPAPPTKTEAKH